MEQSEKNGGAQPEKTFTQAELDHIVETRLGRAKADMRKELMPEVEADIRKQIEEEQSEAKKLKRMDADQRREYENQQKDDRIAELEAKVNRNEMERVATDLLSKKGIAADTATLNFVVADDAKTTSANIEKFVSLVEQKAQSNRRKEFSDPTPKNGGSGEKSVDLATFKKMGYSERAELKQSQPRLYSELAKQTY